MDCMLNSTEIERTVTLLPLPEQLRLPDIAICTKNHWITTDAYFNNLTFEGIENLFYVIGFTTLYSHQIESAVIKYQNQYFSPMLADSVSLPFRAVFEMDACSMFNFREQYHRPPVYADYVDGLVPLDGTIE